MPRDAALTPASRAPSADGADARLARPPTPAQIAAKIRRQPIGAVIADICRDLGIRPNHPLWRELRDAIVRYGGSLARLVKDICDCAFQSPASLWPLSSPLAPALRFPAPSGTGPP